MLIIYLKKARDFLFSVNIKRLVSILIVVASLASLPLPTLAASTSSNATKGKTSALPVEVTSDRLEVLQKEQQAIFSGNVRAVQGEVAVESSQMTVYYKDHAARNTVPAPTSGGTAHAVSPSIEKINAEGQVRLSTPLEKAQADRGTMHMGAQHIILEGNVVLIRGKNILTGERLVYHTDTGQSELASSEGVSQGGKPKERVRGVFVPEGE